ncbi:MAG: hypothetical protein HGB17_10910 [Syntrophobacteraceae bacterium]|nr:hypothetical protein [Syntrophobacteraceae bacterium]
MSESEETKAKGITRREALKAGALALGGLAVGGKLLRAGDAPEDQVCPPPGVVQYPDPNPDDFKRYSYFFGGNGQPGLPTYNPWDSSDPNTPVQANEMRILFLGSCIPPRARAQMEMSIYVEVGPTATTAGDSFLFDCG